MRFYKLLSFSGPLKGTVSVFFLLFFVLNLHAQKNPEDLISLLVKKGLIGKAEGDSLLYKVNEEKTQQAVMQPRLKVWALAYMDVIYKAHTDSAKRGNLYYSGSSKDSAALDFRRIYLGCDYQYNQTFSGQLIFAHESPSDLLQSGNRAVFIKSAFVKWKNIYPMADLVAGQTQTPSFFFEGERETAIWPYRSVERSMADMRKLGTASDAGLLIQGLIAKDGTVGYNLMVGNGSGTKPETDKFKKIYGEVYLKFWKKHFTLDLYADYERTRLSPFQQSKTTYKVFLAYQSERFTLAAEMVNQIQQNYSIFTEGKPGAPSLPGVRSDTVNAFAYGISAFARFFLFQNKLAVFFRYDYYNPDLQFSNKNFYGVSYAGNTKQKFITAGLDYIPEKNIHIIPNIWFNQFLTTSDGYNRIRSNTLMNKDYDLVFRLTVAYTFNK
jgi:hypothetical protein